MLEGSGEGDENLGSKVPIFDDKTTDGGFGAELVEFIELGLNSTVVDDHSLAEELEVVERRYEVLLLVLGLQILPEVCG